VLTGGEMLALHEEALWHAAERTDLFVEVDPNQKERIILALKKMGHVVGFLGDGVNDAPAMHAADTSLSVDDAVDVAREAADFVLLERNLDVIRKGIEEGRKTFANTMKYVLTTTSANLGNMLSMAAASLFLPFLPLLAGQILLNNFLSDIPAVGIADDHVDAELVRRPERWNIRFIGRFMLTFGMLSSAFDGLLFATLLLAFQVTPAVFRTAWFVESLLTELVIALVVRTRRPFFRSRPGSLLLWSTILLLPLALGLPFLPHAELLDFVPLSGPLLLDDLRDNGGLRHRRGRGKGVVLSRRRCASMTGSAWGFFPLGGRNPQVLRAQVLRKRATPEECRPSWSCGSCQTQLRSSCKEPKMRNSSDSHSPVLSSSDEDAELHTRVRRNSRKCPA
jgi:Mg2+-importing ATPase